MLTMYMHVAAAVLYFSSGAAVYGRSIKHTRMNAHYGAGHLRRLQSWLYVKP